MKISNALVEKLQVWGFESGRLIFKDFSLGAILEINPRDISCSTDESINSLHQIICDFLNGLPSKMFIQFVQVIDHGVDAILESHKALSSTSAPELARKLLDGRENSFRDDDEAGKIPRQKVYLVIRRPFVRKIKRERRGFKLWEKKDEIKEWPSEILEPELKLFNQMMETLRKGLDGFGVRSKELDESSIFKILHDQWNPGGLTPPPMFDQEDIRDFLLFNDLLVTTKGFMLGQVHHRVISLKMMPEQTFASMSEKLKDMPFDSRLFLSIETLDQSKEDFVLQTQRRMAWAMQAGKKGVSDLDSQAKLSDIEGVLAKRVKGETKIFSVALNVILRGTDEGKIESEAEEVLQKIRELSGCEAMLESLAATSIFFDLSLPNSKVSERSKKMTTEILADFLPIFGEWKGHDEPRVLLKNSQGNIVGFDPFSPRLGNYNQIISGGSGAGKSHLTNLMISQLMKEDPKVFIIDVGGSYSKITKNLGGQYIPIGSDLSLSINPFDMSERNIETIDLKIKFLTSLVELMTKEDGAIGIGKLERSEIESAIQRILHHSADPSLSMLREQLLANDEPSIKKMGKILSPWCGDSPYGKLMDRPTSLELDKKVVCFDLKGMESHPDLQAVTLFLITDLIWREVQRDKTNPKFVVFDECWSLLENEAGSRFLGEVFRTFRKYKASAIAISQTMDDFAKSRVAQAILPNASVKWILKQTGGNIPSLQEILRLNSREVKRVEKLESKKGFYSEAFLIAGDDRQVLKLEGSPLEYWLATTDPIDMKMVETFHFQHSEMSDLQILETLSEKFPNGASPSIS